MLWTNLLVEQGASSSMVITLKASRLEEKQGRVLKLFGGVLMMALAAVMLIDPSLMNDLGTSAVIFVTAFSVAGVILIVHRTILPQLGIWVGSEAQEKHVHKHTQADQGEE